MHQVNHPTSVLSGQMNVLLVFAVCMLAMVAQSALVEIVCPFG